MSLCFVLFQPISLFLVMFSTLSVSIYELKSSESQIITKTPQGSTTTNTQYKTSERLKVTSKRSFWFFCFGCEEKILELRFAKRSEGSPTSVQSMWQDFLLEFLGDGKCDCVMLLGPSVGWRQSSGHAEICPENALWDSTALCQINTNALKNIGKNVKCEWSLGWHKSLWTSGDSNRKIWRFSSILEQ